MNAADESQEQCIVEALKPSCQLSDLFSAHIPMKCIHSHANNKNPRWYVVIDKLKRIIIVALYSIALLAIIAITILPIEQTRLLCGDMMLCLGKDTLIAKVFAIITVSAGWCMISSIHYSYTKGVELDIDDPATNEQEITSIKAYQVKLLGMLLVISITNNCSAATVVATHGFNYVEKEGGTLLAAICTVAVTAGCYWMEAAVSTGGIMGYLYLTVVRNRWKHLLETLEAIDLQDREQQVGKLVKYSHNRYETIRLQVDQLKAGYDILATLTYFLGIGFLGYSTFILKYISHDYKMTAGLICGITWMTSSMLFALFGAASLPTLAERIIKEVAKLRFFKMNFRDRMRLLCFLKRMGSVAPGFEILQVTVTRAAVIKFCESLVSFYSTVSELDSLRYKKVRCVHREVNLFNVTS